MCVLGQSVQRSTAPTVFALAAIYDHPLAARNALKTPASGFAVSPGSIFFFFFFFTTQSSWIQSPENYSARLPRSPLITSSTTSSSCSAKAS